MSAPYYEDDSVTLWHGDCREVLPTLGQFHVCITDPPYGDTSLAWARSEGRDGCRSWIDYMRAGLRDVADCDGVALLPGWGDSRGAALEAHVARSLDLPVRMVDEWLGGES